jgi:putative redox protein
MYSLQKILIIEKGEPMINHVKVVWNKDVQFIGLDDYNHKIVLDQGSNTDGIDEGFRPSQLLLLGLAGCTGMDVISIMQKRNVTVTRFEIEVTGEANDEYPKKYNRMHILYQITGHHIKEAELKHAIELSEKKYCIVRNTLTPSVSITSDFTITESE